MYTFQREFYVEPILLGLFFMQAYCCRTQPEWRDNELEFALELNLSRNWILSTKTEQY
jgi:hypothetical protein